jgi:hypothetical protein
VTARGPLTIPLLIIYRRRPAQSGHVAIPGDTGLFDFCLGRVAFGEPALVRERSTCCMRPPRRSPTCQEVTSCPLSACGWAGKNLGHLGTSWEGTVEGGVDDLDDLDGL